MGKSLLFFLVLSLAGVESAVAQTFPTKPVTVVVPYPPGGGYDSLARLLAPSLAAVLKQPFLVENRAGAGGTIAMASIARAPADGYALLLGGAGDFAISPHLYSKLSYDVHREFSPIAMVATFPLMLVVSPNVAADSVAQLVGLAKRTPKGLTYASASIGSTGHISSELFRTAADIPLVHVPYKGAAPAVADLIVGRTDMMISDIGTLQAHVRAGKIRPLAVTASVRAAAFPGIPTMVEAGINFEVVGWYGVFAPAGTPVPVLAGIERALASVVQSAEVKPRIEAMALDVSFLPGAGLQSRIRIDSEKFGRAVQASGAKLD